MPRRLLGKQKSYAPAEYRVKHRRDLIIPIYYSNPLNIRYLRACRLCFVKNRECSPKGALSECLFQIGNEGSGFFGSKKKALYRGLIFKEAGGREPFTAGEARGWTASRPGKGEENFQSERP